MRYKRFRNVLNEYFGVDFESIDELQSCSNEIMIELIKAYINDASSGEDPNEWLTESNETASSIYQICRNQLSAKDLQAQLDHLFISYYADNMIDAASDLIAEMMWEDLRSSNVPRGTLLKYKRDGIEV